MKEVLEFSAHAYGFDVKTISFVSESTNKVYEFERESKRYILRIAQKPIESISDTKAEIEWLYYLSQKGVNVSLPLYTLNNELVTSTVDNNGKNYIISVYEKASGVFWDKNDSARWNTDIFHGWGSVMGEMHRLTKDFIPSDTKCKRNRFKGNFALADSYKYQSDVKKIADEIIQQIMQLPQDAHSFGLIHNDFHPWNFYIDGKDIRVFDFDDCLYGWFAMDIGIALFHGLWWGRPQESSKAQEFSKEFIQAFLKGYNEQNHLESFWFETIPLFMRYRQICAFSWFFNPNTISEEQEKQIHNIKNGILFDDCNPEPSCFDISLIEKN